jgi:hypothetical protein
MLPNEFEGQFDELQELVNDVNSSVGDSFEDVVNTSDSLNEYGEVEDSNVDSLDLEDNVQEANTLNSGDMDFALRGSHSKHSTSFSNAKSWLKRSYLAPNETDKEFEMFRVYCLYGGGRSLLYIAQITNISPTTIQKVSSRNNWQRRTQDYDRAKLAEKIKQSQDSKHELHIRKLEAYRQEQEALGKQLTLNAARIAFIANNSLSKLIDEEKDLDIRDLPSILNTAGKLAEVGKNLQSSALGVDNLLAAVEEAESE